MTHADSPSAPTGRTWAIATTNGYTATGYLPPWAEDDPSTTGIEPEALHAELSDITHEAPFGGHFARVCPAGEDPGHDSVILTAYIQCSPYTEDEDPQARVPVANLQLVDDLWITNLNPSRVAEVAAMFHTFADLLANKVAPELAAARADWAEHHPVTHPQD